MKTIPLLTLLLVLGCGPSARQQAATAARQDFCRALSDMQVCSRNTTYAEFRKQRIALEKSYEANRSWLGAVTNQFPALRRELVLCDILFLDSIDYRNEPTNERSNVWYAVMNLQPEVRHAALNESKVAGFMPERAVPFQLAAIAGQCEQLAKRVSE